MRVEGRLVSEKGDPKMTPRNVPLTKTIKYDFETSPGEFGPGLAECADPIWLLTSKIPDSGMARHAHGGGRRICSVAPRIPPGLFVVV